jgi:glyoxylase-like metal-dependent hydrolase (beta-lactamase superfamily II)
MFTAADRRDFLKALAACAVGASVSFPLRGQDAKPESAAAPNAKPATLEATKLTDDLALIRGAGGNVIVILSPDGLAMVDGGLPDRSPELLKLVAEQGQNQPVKLLFNTHWHLDHTGSNETLGKAGVKIIAHANTKKWLKTRVFVEAQNRTYEKRPPEALPTETFYTTGKMTFGKTAIEYGHLPFGHTDGDIYVFFPQSNIMVVSDILAVGRYPVMDYSTGGWIGGMEEANAALLKMVDDKTRIIAGTGAPQAKPALQAQHDMVADVKNKVVVMVRQGKGYSEIAAAQPTKDFDNKYGNPDLFVSMTYKGILRNLHEIGGII